MKLLILILALGLAGCAVPKHQKNCRQAGSVDNEPVFMDCEKL